MVEITFYHLISYIIKYYSKLKIITCSNHKKNLKVRNFFLHYFNLETKLFFGHLFRVNPMSKTSRHTIILY